jgi:hypothetical protein
MTCVEFGGGPSISQRRSFTSLKSGSHIAGYQGFVPQLKYNYGATYDELTHRISESVPYFHGPRAKTFALENKSNEFIDSLPHKKLPASTGANRLTGDLIPGYTGNIPQYNFKFGKTYKSLCDECVDEFVTNSETRREKEEINRLDYAKPNQSPRVHMEVTNHLNQWSDHGITGGFLRSDRRRPKEAPIPGYKGFLPGINTTDVGLGQRYTITGERALQQFYDAPRQVEKMSEGRLYVAPGMIPRYTGYLPHARFEFGETYGNLTRSLDVCKHPYTNYGDYIKIKTARN